MSKRNKGAIMKISLSMANERAFAIQKIGQLSDQVTTHLMKVVAMPECQDTRGWLKELTAWLTHIAGYTKLTKGAHLKASDLKHTLFGLCDKDSLPSIWANILAEDYPSVTWSEEHTKKVCEIAKEAAEQLGKKNNSTMWNAWLRSRLIPGGDN